MRVRAADRVAPAASPARGGRSTYANSPVDLGDAVAADDGLADAADARAVLRGQRSCSGRAAARRRGSSRSRCSGRGCRTGLADLVVRGRRRVARAGRPPPRPAPACRSRTAPRRVSTNASWTRWSAPSSARPSTVTTSWPSACARGRGTSRRARRPGAPSTSRTRPARRRSSSRAGRGARAARYSRLSPGQTSVSRRSPLTRQRDPHAEAPLERAARRARAARGGGRRPCRGRRRSATPRPRRGSGKPSASSSGTRDERRDRPGRAERRRASSPRSRSAATASEQTAITIALRGPTFMKVCGAPVGVDETRGDQLVRPRARSASGRRGTRRAASCACRATLATSIVGAARRAAAAARRRRARRCRGCRRSCRGSGSAASRPCAPPRRAPAAPPRARVAIASV